MRRQALRERADPVVLDDGPAGGVFAQAPFMAVWEVMRACDLACLHCRAAALPWRDPRELSTAEGFRLMEEVRRFGPILFILTGGDPLKRPDLFELIAHGHALGLRMALSPSGTPLLTEATLARARQAGASGLSISIDGSRPEIHDAFRGVPGSFRRCLDGARSAGDLGFHLQINTTVTGHNVADLEAIAALITDLGADRWSVFFLVPTGRGEKLQPLDAQEQEGILRWLFQLSKTCPLRIKTTEAQHYRRVVLERLAGEKGTTPAGVAASTRSGHGRFMPGINAGKGFVFVSHLGDIFPSGFLPLGCGNVRQRSLVDTYRRNPVFVALRDPERLTGRCGACAFRRLCGGSRARAYALSGDYLAEDPACAYQPSPGGVA